MKKIIYLTTGIAGVIVPFSSAYIFTNHQNNVKKISITNKAATDPYAKPINEFINFAKSKKFIKGDFLSKTEEQYKNMIISIFSNFLSVDQVNNNFLKNMKISVDSQSVKWFNTPVGELYKSSSMANMKQGKVINNATAYNWAISSFTEKIILGIYNQLPIIKKEFPTADIPSFVDGLSKEVLCSTPNSLDNITNEVLSEVYSLYNSNKPVTVDNYPVFDKLVNMDFSKPMNLSATYKEGHDDPVTPLPTANLLIQFGKGGSGYKTFDFIYLTDRQNTSSPINSIWNGWWEQ